MKGSSAPGVDGIPAKIWKIGKTVLVPVLAAVFSFMTKKRKWPDQWNLSVGIPIFKKGKRLDQNNYRIISLGNVMSKIFCKVIESRLGKWLDEKELLSPFQVGFRKSHSSIDHIFTLRILAEKYRLFAAFLDLKGAYGNVDRHLLMLNLLSLGLPHYFVLLLCKMYKYVKLVARVAGKCSTPVLSLLGLKQGCVLSPKRLAFI